MIKKYTKDSTYTYIQGAFGVIEALESKPEVINEIIISFKLNDELRIKIQDLSKKKGISVIVDDRTLERLQEKESILVIAIIEKRKMSQFFLSKDKNHLVLVNPSDKGNLGSIIRSMVGFNYFELVIIEPSCDIFDPKVLRASMGSLFKIKFKLFKSFEEYQSQFPRTYYPFVLKGTTELSKMTSVNQPHSLIFGNESSGLPDSFLNLGNSIVINHSNQIDSLNLASSVAISLYNLSKFNRGE